MTPEQLDTLRKASEAVGEAGVAWGETLAELSPFDKDARWVAGGYHNLSGAAHHLLMIIGKIIREEAK